MCVVPGLVVVKIIYTPEEAERRKIEDREVIEAFEKSMKLVRDEKGGGAQERGKYPAAIGRYPRAVCYGCSNEEKAVVVDTALVVIRVLYIQCFCLQ